MTYDVPRLQLPRQPDKVNLLLICETILTLGNFNSYTNIEEENEKALGALRTAAARLEIQIDWKTNLYISLGLLETRVGDLPIPGNSGFAVQTDPDTVRATPTHAHTLRRAQRPHREHLLPTVANGSTPRLTRAQSRLARSVEIAPQTIATSRLFACTLTTPTATGKSFFGYLGSGPSRRRHRQRQRVV